MLLPIKYLHTFLDFNTTPSRSARKHSTLAGIDFRLRVIKPDPALSSRELRAENNRRKEKCNKTRLSKQPCGDSTSRNSIFGIKFFVCLFKILAALISLYRLSILLKFPVNVSITRPDPNLLSKISQASKQNGKECKTLTSKILFSFAFDPLFASN